MVKEIMFYSISLYLFFFIGCLSSTEHHHWNVEWNIYNGKDSTLVKDTIYTEVRLNNADLNDGPWYDTTTLGVVKIQMGLYSEIISEELLLITKIFIGNIVKIDTSFVWDNISFVKGVDKDGYKNQDVFKYNFYIVNE